jgi:hypothetical protein
LCVFAHVVYACAEIFLFFVLGREWLPQGDNCFYDYV